MQQLNPYQESMRYIDNERETLKLAGKEDEFYKDIKYVQTACGTAYLGILKSLDYLFEIKSVPKKRGRKSIEHYLPQLSGIDENLLDYLNDAYTILHLEGYYGGIRKIAVIEQGFDDAVTIINTLKPYSNNVSY